MRVFAIADLHMDGGAGKPMDVFGNNWNGHVERIFAAWQELVEADDWVLVAGDISWAMYLKDAVQDLQKIGTLPGRKVLVRGNHDYWWSSVTRIRTILPEDMHVLQNDALDLGNMVVCGTRGWKFPGGDEELTEEDEKIYRRELMRMEMSLKTGRQMAGERPLAVMMHYPPLNRTARESGFTLLMQQYSVHTCVYGHLHAAGIASGFTGEQDGIRYVLTSCDALGFVPTKIFDFEKK